MKAALIVVKVHKQVTDVMAATNISKKQSPNTN